MISTRSSVSTHKKGSKVSCNTVCEMLLQIKKSYAISEFGPMRLMSPDQTRQGPVSSAPAWSDPSPQPGRGEARNLACSKGNILCGQEARVPASREHVPSPARMGCPEPLVHAPRDKEEKTLPSYYFGWYFFQSTSSLLTGSRQSRGALN